MPFKVSCNFENVYRPNQLDTSISIIAWLGVKFRINFTSVVVRMVKIARGEAMHAFLG